MLWATLHPDWSIHATDIAQVHVDVSGDDFQCVDPLICCHWSRTRIFHIHKTNHMSAEGGQRKFLKTTIQ